jgi:uncharacterized protein (DUF433 family)
MSTVLATTLVRTPDVCGGKLRIDGTRMTVNQIVTLYHQGFTAEQIADQYELLSRREVYAVLAWYQDHQQEFDAELAVEAAADQAAIDEIAASRR